MTPPIRPREASAHAPGKLILCGEHAVVYGYPALAFAVDAGTRATLTRRPGPLDVRVASGEPLSADAEARLLTALAAELPAEGVGLTLRSTLPLGRGMGSSAALAVAVVRAHSTLLEAPLDDDAVFARALQLERVFHGTPSGLDVAVAVHGGAVRFQRAAPDARPSVTPCDPPPFSFVVLDTGRAGDTAALVAGVRARRPGIDGTLARIGQLADEALAICQQPQALGALLDENQRLLAEIGVSTPEVDALCQLARDHGALGAKLSGAGGGGVVIALAPQPAPVLAAAERAGVPAWTVLPRGSR